MSTVNDTTPSHDIALALAIVMREDDCDADVAVGRVRRRASRTGTTLDGAATGIVTAGTSRPSKPSCSGDLLLPTAREEKVHAVQRALLTLMRENACDDNYAATTLRVRAAQHQLSILDVAAAINDLNGT